VNSAGAPFRQLHLCRNLRWSPAAASRIIASFPMHQPPSKDPLHGITLETMVTALVAHFGWEELGGHIPIRCFNLDPSISSSLKFLRKTPWARKRVEDLYLAIQPLPESEA
jgi:uncharacterized protein (DUF2132 family)